MPFVIVVIENIEREAVFADDVQQSLGLIAGEFLAGRCFRSQPDRLVKFGHPPAVFRQPLVVDGEPADGMIAEHACGPDTKLGATPRVHAVPHRNNRVEVVEPDRPPDLPTPLPTNYRGFLGSCPFV